LRTHERAGKRETADQCREKDDSPMQDVMCAQQLHDGRTEGLEHTSLASLNARGRALVIAEFAKPLRPPQGLCDPEPQDGAAEMRGMAGDLTCSAFKFSNTIGSAAS
jgi:hypothetical protein